MLHFKPHTCTDPLQSLWWFGSDQCSQLLCQVAHNTSSLTGTLPPCGVYMCSKQPKDQSWQVALKALDCNSGYGCWFDLSLLHLKTGILCLGDHWEYWAPREAIKKKTSCSDIWESSYEILFSFTHNLYSLNEAKSRSSGSPLPHTDVLSSKYWNVLPAIQRSSPRWTQCMAHHLTKSGWKCGSPTKGPGSIHHDQNQFIVDVFKAEHFLV